MTKRISIVLVLLVATLVAAAKPLRTKTVVHTWQMPGYSAVADTIAFTDTATLNYRHIVPFYYFCHISPSSFWHVSSALSFPCSSYRIHTALRRHGTYNGCRTSCYVAKTYIHCISYGHPSVIDTIIFLLVYAPVTASRFSF